MPSSSVQLPQIQPLPARLPRALVAVASAAALVTVFGAAPAVAAPAGVSPTPVSSATADGRVEAMAAAGGKVFIGGRFRHVGGAAHRSVAAVNAGSGAVVGSWHASVVGEVKALAAVGGTLYIGGDFSSVNGARRANLAAVRVSNGSLLPWNPGANRTVEALAVGAGKVFVGGRFQTIAHHSAANLAALQPGSGAYVSGFRGNASNFVFTLQVGAGGSKLYVGGAFGKIAGVSRPRLAAVSTRSGAPTSWHPRVGCPVYDLAATSSSVYIGCAGGRKTGNRVSAYSTSGSAPRWSVKTNGNVQALELVGGGIYVGGHFGTAAGRDRHHALALTSSGKLTSWAPRFNSALGVYALLAAGGNLFAGGDFTTVNSAHHPHLVRFRA